MLESVASAGRAVVALRAPPVDDVCVDAAAEEDTDAENIGICSFGPDSHSGLGAVKSLLASLQQ